MRNRAIKFRVWDKHLNKFVSFDLIGHVDFNDKTYVFQQFTGLLDKNGKEIYEGDIISLIEDDKIIEGSIKISIQDGQIYFNTQPAVWVLECILGTSSYTEYGLGGAAKRGYFKVVGNICE